MEYLYRYICMAFVMLIIFIGCQTAAPEFESGPTHLDLSLKQLQSYKKYLDPKANPDLKAFAVEIRGDRAGWSRGYYKPENAIEAALQLCGRKGADCVLYAVGERVVKDYPSEQLSKYLREYYEEVFPPGDLRDIIQRALSGDEIKKLITGHKGEGVSIRTGSKFTVQYMSSGNLVLRIVETQTATKTGSYAGKWWVEDDRFCRYYYKLWSGKADCFYIIKEKNGIVSYNNEASLIGRIRFTNFVK